MVFLLINAIYEILPRQMASQDDTVELVNSINLTYLL